MYAASQASECGVLFDSTRPNSGSPHTAPEGGDWTLVQGGMATNITEAPCRPRTWPKFEEKCRETTGPDEADKKKDPGPTYIHKSCN